MESFFGFSVPHAMVIGLMVLLPVICAALSRRYRVALLTIKWLLTVLLLGNKGFSLYWATLIEGMEWRDVLPLHVCDLATVWVILALWSRKQIWMDWAYFWGLAGTLQAVFTPDLVLDYPHVRWFLFFISHAGIVAGVLYLVLGVRRRVYVQSIWRAWVGILVYAVFAGCVNAILGTNYGYLCRPPGQPSLIDYLGPWPWYIGSLVVLAIVKFAIYYAPFALWDWWRGRRG